MAARSPSRKASRNADSEAAPKPSANTFSIRSTPQVLRELDLLKQVGLFGNSRAEIAEELMRAQLRQLHREGWFRPPLAPLLDVTPTAADGGSDDQHSSGGNPPSGQPAAGSARSRH
jgi:hypothetical protein